MKKLIYVGELKKIIKKYSACPESTVYHFGGGTIEYHNPLKHYYNHRNSLLLLVKNMQLKNLFGILIARILLDYLIIFFYTIQGCFFNKKRQLSSYKNTDY